MFKECDDEAHVEQATEFLLALGNFLIQFERVCEAMKHQIMLMLQSEGLQNYGMQQVIIGDKTSVELQVLMGALFQHLPNCDAEDKNEVKKLLGAIKSLTEKRNILLHSCWNLGAEASPDELVVSTVRYRAKQNNAVSSELHGLTASYINELIDEGKRLQVLLQRLQTCTYQSGFKVSAQLAKSVHA